jgi:hypothetical protein
MHESSSSPMESRESASRRHGRSRWALTRALRLGSEHSMDIVDFNAQGRSHVRTDPYVWDAASLDKTCYTKSPGVLFWIGYRCDLVWFIKPWNSPSSPWPTAACSVWRTVTASASAIRVWIRCALRRRPVKEMKKRRSVSISSIIHSHHSSQHVCIVDTPCLD